MSILLILILSIIAGLQYVDSYGTQIFTMNYMLWSVLVGFIMGDPLTGLIIGATIQLMSLGVAALGGSSTPNYGMAAIIATAITISTKQDMSVGLAVGIAAGALGVQLDIIVKVLNGFVVRKSQDYCNKGNFTAMENILYLGPVLFFLSAAIPTFIVCGFGSSVADFIVNKMPGWFTSGLNIATGLLPVIGMGMLLTYMPTKKYFGFVAVGFVLAAYVNLSVLPVAIIGGAFAYEYYKKQIAVNANAALIKGGADEDE
jgi:PTS system mannose-specific IIC component